MSSDFLEDIDDDENGSTVRLTMKASGDAFLYADGDFEDHYHLAPNETGWKNAEKIATAINTWIQHTKRIAYSDTAPHHVGVVVEKDDHCALKISDMEYKLVNFDSKPTKKTWLYYVDKQI